MTDILNRSHDRPPGRGGVRLAAGFLALVSLGALALLVQWLVIKVNQADGRIDIAEWPFVAAGAVLALLPLIAAVGLLAHRPFGPKLGRVSAYLIAIAGGLALLMALSLLTMGVAWNLLIGGAVALAGAIWTLWTLRAIRP
jgi:hypothetical protein